MDDCKKDCFSCWNFCLLRVVSPPMPDDEPPVDTERAIAEAKRLREQAQRLVNQARNIEQRMIFAEAEAALVKKARANGADKRGILSDPSHTPGDESQSIQKAVQKLTGSEPVDGAELNGDPEARRKVEEAKRREES
jgi:hypothetical protein